MRYINVSVTMHSIHGGRYGVRSPVALTAILVMCIIGGCSRSEKTEDGVVYVDNVVAAPADAVVLKTYGEVKFYRVHAWRAVEKEDVLTPGDTVVTAKGEMIFEWEKGCRVRLGNMSTARFLKPQRGFSKKGAPGRVRLKWGHISTLCSDDVGGSVQVEMPKGFVETDGDAVVEVTDKSFERISVLRRKARYDSGDAIRTVRPDEYIVVSGGRPSEIKMMSASARAKIREENDALSDLLVGFLKDIPGKKELDIDKIFRLWGESRFGMTAGSENATETMETHEETDASARRQIPTGR